MGGASEWKTTKRQLLTANTNQTNEDESNPARGKPASPG